MNLQGGVNSGDNDWHRLWLITELQWEEYLNCLKGQKITLKGKAFEVDEKGFIRKRALVHLAEEDSELKFYAACKTDINTGLITECYEITPCRVSAHIFVFLT